MKGSSLVMFITLLLISTIVRSEESPFPHVISWSLPDQSVVISLNQKKHLLEIGEAVPESKWILAKLTSNFAEFKGAPRLGEYIRVFFGNNSQPLRTQRFTLLPE